MCNKRAYFPRQIFAAPKRLSNFLRQFAYKGFDCNVLSDLQNMRKKYIVRYTVPVPRAVHAISTPAPDISCTSSIRSFKKFMAR